jgi:hypothetical protein
MTIQVVFVPIICTEPRTVDGTLGDGGCGRSTAVAVGVDSKRPLFGVFTHGSTTTDVDVVRIGVVRGEVVGHGDVRIGITGLVVVVVVVRVRVRFCMVDGHVDVGTIVMVTAVHADVGVGVTETAHVVGVVRHECCDGDLLVSLSVIP